MLAIMWWSLRAVSLVNRIISHGFLHYAATAHPASLPFLHMLLLRQTPRVQLGEYKQTNTANGIQTQSAERAQMAASRSVATDRPLFRGEALLSI